MAAGCERRQTDEIGDARLRRCHIGKHGLKAALGHGRFSGSSSRPGRQGGPTQHDLRLAMAIYPSAASSPVA